MNYKEFNNVIGKVVNTTKPLKRLIGKPNAEDKTKASLLIKAGVALIAFPDPTITDLIGASLVLAGFVMNRMKGPTLADVCKSYQEISKELESIRRGITVL